MTSAAVNPGTHLMSVFTEYVTALKERLVEEIQVGNIGEEISHAIVPKTVYALDLFGRTVRITDAVLATWVAMLVIFALGWYFGRRTEAVPTNRRQLAAESLVDLLMNLCTNAHMTIEQAQKVVPFVGTIAIFISLTNLTSMFKIPPPAKNPAFPIALALLTIGYVIVTSIRFVGLRGFWESMVYPMKALLPFKILDFFIKPISLSLRLFGNVFGAFILMEFVYIVIPAFVPGLVGLWFDLADGLLQGAIFTYLSITYIGEVIEGAHAAHEAREALEMKHSVRA